MRVASVPIMPCPSQAGSVQMPPAQVATMQGNYMTPNRSYTAPPPVTYAASPPVYARPVVSEYRGPVYQQEAVEMPFYRGPVYQQEAVERPLPVTYLAPPSTAPIVMHPVQEVVEVIRDDNEILALRNELEDRVQLINDFGRFNAEIQQRNVELERLLGETEVKISMGNSERQTLQSGLSTAERKLLDRETEVGTLREERDRQSLQLQNLEGRDLALEEEVRQLQGQVAQLQDQDEQLRVQDGFLRAQNEELQNCNSEQAQRMVELADQAAGFEQELNRKQLDIDALTKTNRELEARLRAETQRIADLEAMVQELRQGPAAPEPPAPSAPESNLSDEDFIDRKIQEFFLTHTDFQMAVNKEKPGLYKFDKPIGKKVNMKVQGDRVLARVGGGWQVLEEWLLEERQHFLEAENLEDRLEAAPAHVPAQTQMRAPGAGVAPRLASPAPRGAVAKRTAASKAPGAARAVAKAPAGGARSVSAAPGRAGPRPGAALGRG